MHRRKDEPCTPNQVPKGGSHQYLFAVSFFSTGGLSFGGYKDGGTTVTAQDTGLLSGTLGNPITEEAQAGPVLVTGEAGVGKTWLWRRLQAEMPRSWRWVVVDLPPALDSASLSRLMALAGVPARAS